MQDNGNSISKLNQAHYVAKAVEKYGYDRNVFVAESPMKESYAIEKKPDDELFKEKRNFAQR